MKKLLLSAALFVGCFSANAQLANGSVAPDWTFTDLNGTSWNLYTLTAAGKTVFIDVSATWCGPCWGYHNSGALEDLYNQHGPTGTISNEVMVFFIEGDGTTTVAELNGVGASTQGNWVTGTPYPIIDPGMGAPSDNFNTDYAIGYFPTIYKVCSDNKIYEVGQLPTAGLVASINSCPFATDAYASAGPTTLQCSGTFSPTFTLKNNGSTTMTSCDVTYEYDNNGTVLNNNWTGSLAPGQSTVITLPSGTFTAGNHVLQVVTTNPNGLVDQNGANNTADYSFSVVAAGGTALPYTNSFTNAVFPYANWVLNNADAGITWARVTTNTGALKYDCYNYGAQGQSDEFIMEPFDFSTGSVASLNFDVAHVRYSTAYSEELEVLVSTDCGATWISKWLKSGDQLATVATASTAAFTPTAAQWRTECINMTEFLGNSKVFVKFKGTNDYGNNIYVDGINVSTTACALGIEEGKTETFKVYPNPASDVLNVSFEAVNSDYVVTMLDLQGRVVASQNHSSLNGAQTLSIPVSEFAKGSYIVTILTNGISTSQNVIIK